jgi:regulator of protease activity HflC (stomatin/prohibitin superfamily)
MGYLLFILFIAFFLFALWRSFAVSLSVHDGRTLDFSISRGLPFLLVAALIFIFWLSFTTVDAGCRGVALRFGALTGRTLEPGPAPLNQFPCRYKSKNSTRRPPATISPDGQSMVLVTEGLETNGSQCTR